jgi:hypothetical protein
MKKSTLSRLGSAVAAVEDFFSLEFSSSMISTSLEVLYLLEQQDGEKNRNRDKIQTNSRCLHGTT